MSVAVIIGRFQGFHLGHAELFRTALSNNPDKLIVCLGSHAVARTTRNPFTSKEREALIKLVYPDTNIIFEYIHDHPGNDAEWVKEITSKVYQNALVDTDITLYGKHKNDTTYLDMFREFGWKYSEVESETVVTATELRHALYFNKPLDKLTLDSLIAEYKIWVDKSHIYTQLAEAYKAELEFRKDYECLKYPPIFVAIDALVTCQGHILLIKRKGKRGKGLFALPGGFLESTEPLLDGAIRELQEETNLNVSKEALLKFVGKKAIFDNPNRAVLSRVISVAYHFNLPHDICNGYLPTLKAGDDADAAFWVPVEKFRGDYYTTMDSIRETFFEDHLEIIKTLLADIKALQ